MSTSRPSPEAGYQWNSPSGSNLDVEIGNINAQMAVLEHERLRLIYEGGGEARWGEVFSKQLEQLRDDGFVLNRLAILGTGGGAHLQKAVLQIFPEVEIDVFEWSEEKCREAQETIQREFPEAAHRVHHIVGDVRETMAKRIQEKGGLPYDALDMGLFAEHLPDAMLEDVLNVGVMFLRPGGRMMLRDVLAEHWQVTPHDMQPYYGEDRDEYLRRQRESWADQSALRDKSRQKSYIDDLIRAGYTDRGAELSPSAEALAKRILRLNTGLQLMPSRYNGVRLAIIRPGSAEEKLIGSIIDINELAIMRNILLLKQQPLTDERNAQIAVLENTLGRLHNQGVAYKQGIHNPYTTYYYPGLAYQMYEKPEVESLLA